MFNISNIHKSLSFTIVIIISMFFGIIFTMHFSKYKSIKFVTKYFESSSDKEKKIYSKSYDEFTNMSFNILNFEYKKFPKDSIPVFFELGKIKKVNNTYLPNLRLAILENQEKLFFLETKLDFHK